MALIHWSEALHLGIQSIDEQHAQLVSIINELNDALEQGSVNQVIKKVLDELTDYTIMHFKYEEDLFKQYHYVDEAMHVEEHQQLIQNVVELKAKVDQGDFMVGVETMSFLKEWLTQHILKEDKAYASFLIEQGVK